MSERRADDPEHFSGREFRRDESALRIGYKEASLSVRGMGAFLALGIFAIMATTWYSGFQTQQTIIRENSKIAETLATTYRQSVSEHHVIASAEQQTSCILTMEQKDRERFRDRYQSGDFKRWCPWIAEEGGGNGRSH